jgi:hypothetical protein
MATFQDIATGNKAIPYFPGWSKPEPEGEHLREVYEVRRSALPEEWDQVLGGGGAPSALTIPSSGSTRLVSDISSSAGSTGNQALRRSPQAQALPSAVTAPATPSQLKNRVVMGDTSDPRLLDNGDGVNPPGEEFSTPVGVRQLDDGTFELDVKTDREIDAELAAEDGMVDRLRQCLL